MLTDLFFKELATISLYIYAINMLIKLRAVTGRAF